MKTKLSLVVVLAGVIVGCGGVDLCPPFCPPPDGVAYDCDNPPTEPAALFAPKDWKSGRVMIVLSRQADRSGALTLPPEPEAFDTLLSDFSGLTSAISMHNVGMMAANADLKTVLDVVRSGHAKSVYPVQRFSVAPMDAQYVASWGLDAVDDRSGLDGKYEPRGTGAGVRVVVNDTGVDKHAGFGGRVSDFGYSAHPGTSPFYDGHGHGTHVAGTVASDTYGVAKGAIIHACKSLGDDGSGTTDQVIECIDFGIEVFEKYGDPVVGNMSLGGPTDIPLNEALCRSHAAGVPWAVAAGNDYGASACNGSPAQVKQAATVMASNKGDGLASFSNTGECSDIIAPGEDIVSLTPGGINKTMSGTSMASPHVAGAIAICLEIHPEKGVGCLDEVLAWSTEGRISGVPGNAPNQFLYVGEEE